MFGGVAPLMAQPDLGIRVYNRLSVPEVHSRAREDPRLLPVRLGGVLRILPWGNRRGDSAHLPPTL